MAGHGTYGPTPFINFPCDQYVYKVEEIHETSRETKKNQGEKKERSSRLQGEKEKEKGKKFLKPCS